MPSDCLLLKLTPRPTEKPSNQQGIAGLSNKPFADSVSNQVEFHHELIDDLHEDLCALTFNGKSYVHRSWDNLPRRRWRVKWST